MELVIDFRLHERLSTFISAFMEDYSLSLVKSQPTHHFTFLSESLPKAKGLPENLGLRALAKTRFRWFDHQRLTALLKELKADRYLTLSTEGFRIFEVEQGIITRKALITPNRSISFTGPSDGALYLKPIPGFAIAPSWVENENTKTSYTGGKDFFLFTGDLSHDHALIDLLKGFSLFKKWQQSSMQLVLAGDSNKWTGFLDSQLSSYKYREDVVLAEDVEEEELQRLSAACYAMLYPSLKPILPVAMARAIQAGKAIVASDLPINRTALASAYWVDNINISKGFSEGMIALYKDEAQLNALADAARAAAEENSFSDVLQRAWDFIAGGEQAQIS